MNTVAQNISSLTNEEYISKTEAIRRHRSHHFTIDKLIKSDKVKLYLIGSRVLMKADVVAREIEILRAQRSKNHRDLFA